MQCDHHNIAVRNGKIHLKRLVTRETRCHVPTDMRLFQLPSMNSQEMKIAGFSKL